MVKNKVLKVLLSQNRRIDSLRYTEEGVDLLRIIVLEDEGLKSQSLRNFMIVYYQLVRHLSQQALYETEIKRRFSLKNRMKALFK
ncbi:MAG: hypothetical protein ACLVKO_08000 [Dysgonomonas sp.]